MRILILVMDSFTTDNISPSVRKFSLIYCPHCCKEVPKSTYYVHYKRFYDKHRKSWQLESKQAPSKPVREPDFDFQTVESEDNIGTTCESIEMCEDFEFVDLDDTNSYHEDSDYYEETSTLNVSLLHAVNIQELCILYKCAISVMCLNLCPCLYALIIHYIIQLGHFNLISCFKGNHH